MAKLNTSLVTFLCIRGYEITFDHLITLTDIPTLGGLVLERLHSDIDRQVSIIFIYYQGILANM
jgi:hypothetical protein